MKILVVSDSHGKMENFRQAIDIEKPDRIYHLGDSQGVEDAYLFSYDIPAEFIAGNCDFGSNMPSELVLEVGKHVILLTHGHYYGVNYGYSEVVAAAKNKGCDVILYGHTHVPTIDNYMGFMIANPGSIAYPRQSSGEHTYLVITVNADGEFRYDLHSLEEYDRLHGN